MENRTAPPLRVIRPGDGTVKIERAVDQAFRKALLAGCPPEIRSKFVEALAATPHSQSEAHSIRYFGAELADIKNRVAPLLIELDHFLTARYRLPSLFDWLQATGYGGHYKMIKAFAAWADMVKTPSLAVVGAQPAPERIYSNRDARSLPKIPRKVVPSLNG